MFDRFKEFHYYTRPQRRALLLLVSLILVLLTSRTYLRYYYTRQPVDFSEFDRLLEHLAAQDTLTNQSQSQGLIPTKFDPNTASKSELLAAGLAPKVVANMLKYRQKGGRWNQPSDLLKVYGLDTVFYESIEAYVEIAPSAKNKRVFQNDVELNLDSFKLNTVARQTLMKMGLSEREAKGIVSFREKYRLFEAKEDLFQVYNLDSSRAKQLLPWVQTKDLDTAEEKEQKVLELLELNEVDSVSLVQVPGIGSYFAHHILKYRSQLGGYYSIEQLLEIPGMKEERWQSIQIRFTIDASLINPININEADFNEILQHPYLDYSVVRNIINFREEYRTFKNLEELMNLELIDEVLFLKIAPYLTID